MKKIKLSFNCFSGLVRETNAEILNQSIIDSRWAKGIATINGEEVDVMAIHTIDGWEFERNGMPIERASVTFFNQTEWMEWRDG